MKNKKVVSVVIPTIPGREKLIHRAIKSIKAQTYKNIEPIVVEDASISATEARNKGIYKANGFTTVLLDDDDKFLPEKTAKQLEIFKKYSNTVLVVSWILDKRFDKPYIDKCPKIVNTLEMLKMFHFSSTSSYMFRTDRLKELGGFDTDFPSAQEYELAIRASLIGEVRCVPEVLVEQNKTPGQITKDLKKKKDGMKLLLKKHKKLYRSFGIQNYLYFRLKFLAIINLYRCGGIMGKRFQSIIRKTKERVAIR